MRTLMAMKAAPGFGVWWGRVVAGRGMRGGVRAPHPSSTTRPTPAATRLPGRRPPPSAQRQAGPTPGRSTCDLKKGELGRNRPRGGARGEGNRGVHRRRPHPLHPHSPPPPAPGRLPATTCSQRPAFCHRGRRHPGTARGHARCRAWMPTRPCRACGPGPAAGPKVRGENLGEGVWSGLGWAAANCPCRAARWHFIWHPPRPPPPPSRLQGGHARARGQEPPPHGGDRQIGRPFLHRQQQAADGGCKRGCDAWGRGLEVVWGGWARG